MQPANCASVSVALAVTWWVSLKAGLVTKFTAHPYRFLCGTFAVVLGCPGLWYLEERRKCHVHPVLQVNGSIYPDAMGMDLSSVLDSVPPLALAATAWDCHL